MAVVDGYDLKDPKYLTFLEDSFTRQHAEQDRLQDELEGWKRSSGGSKPGTETSVHDRDILVILDNISKRLGNLEVSSAEQPPASAPAQQASATSQPTASALQASATSQPTALATGPAIATPPAPADLLTGPPTQALAKLSGVAADDSKGKPYRPETYSQKTDKKRDYSKRKRLFALQRGGLGAADQLFAPQRGGQEKQLCYSPRSWASKSKITGKVI